MGLLSKIQIACAGWLSATSLFAVVQGQFLLALAGLSFAVGCWLAAHWRSHL